MDSILLCFGQWLEICSIGIRSFSIFHRVLPALTIATTGFHLNDGPFGFYSLIENC